jgi:ankyrin repeat protein
MMTWARPATGPRWLLEHGADPNLAWGEAGEAPIHVTARRWDVPMAELLVSHGADVRKRQADGRTAHTVAALHGNRAVADWLLAHGAVDELTPVEHFIAACACGDRAAADALLASRPSLRSELRSDDHLMLQRPAESGIIAVLETMLACGFDPNVGDKDHVTPLHRAAMSGHPEAVRVLLAHGAAVNAKDGMFAATPLVWAVEGRRHPRPGGDYVAVARVLIAGGSSLEWVAPEGAPDQESTHDDLAELTRLAGRP